MFPGVEEEQHFFDWQFYGECVQQYLKCCNLFSEIGEMIADLYTAKQSCNKKELASKIVEKCTHLKYLATVLLGEQDNVVHIEIYKLGEDDFVSAVNEFIEMCDVTIPALSKFIKDS